MNKEPLRRAVRLAGSQHGVVTRRQAIAEGMTAKMITGQISQGLWRLLYPSVYVVEGAVLSWRARLCGAVLGGGASAAASHRSAAKLHQLPGCEKPILEITANRLKRLEGVYVHRSPLGGADVATVQCIRTTTVSKTLLDLGAVVDLFRLEAALDDALVRGLTSVDYLERTLQRVGGRGRRGTAPLRRLLAVRVAGQAPTESELERLFHRNVTVRHKLPKPAFQYRGAAPGTRIDFAYAHLQLGIEVLGWKFHLGRAAWEQDLDRHNSLTNKGWAILYFTWSDITKRSGDVAASIRSAIKAQELVLCRDDAL